MATYPVNQLDNSAPPAAAPQPDSSSGTALTTEQQNTIITDPQEWSDDFAKKVCVRDFQSWETYRAYNHDRRFREAERLLTGWVEKKFWEGTKVQRSSVPVFIALQEIEVLQSRLIDQIFSDDPPFECTPQAGTVLAQAFAVRNLLASQLRTIGKPGTFITGREIFRRANKSSLTYGCGIIELGWHLSEVNRKIYDRRAVAETTPVQHPELGQVNVPTGKLKIVMVNREEKRVISQPIAQNIDVRDFYIDPDTPGPSCQETPTGTATRHMVSIEDIKGFQNMPGFKVPDDKTLQDLARKKFATQGDFSKQTAETYRGNQYQPQLDKSVDPASSKVELIRYWRKNRHVQVLGREWVFFNQCNPYQIIPQLNTFYIDFLGRFFGFSIPDLVEGDHKLAMAILNDRIDELNILLHPPIVRKRGSMTGTSGKRFHPGAYWEVAESPREDVVRMDMGTVNPQAFAEVNALELRVQKVTGNTDQAAFGVATSGGDSSSRTATGVSTKTAAASGRLGYQVSNLEDQVLEPFLYILLGLNKIYLDPSQLIQVLGPDQAQLIQLDPLDILNADVHFKVGASQKMKTKQAFSSGAAGMVMQAYFNPAFLQQINMQGMTVDTSNFDRLISDGLDLPEMTFMRKMTPQEMQMMQQQRMAEIQAKQELQTERLQSQQSISASTDETKLIKALMEKLMSPEATHALFEAMFGMKHPAVQAEEAKAKFAPAKSLNQ